MYTVADCYREINNRAPFSTAMPWDNCGLLVGDMNAPLTGVLTALDVTGPVIREAVGLGANLIVTHHPVIFAPVKRLESGSMPYRCAREGLSVISAHTNLDMAECGVNAVLAEMLELKDISPLEVVSSEAARKVVVFVPLSHAREVYEAMCDAGAGKLGNYSHCAFSSVGQGRFLPQPGSRPALGQVGQLETVEEVRLEMLAPPGLWQGVVAAMKKAHPYETPAFDVLLNEGVAAQVAQGRVGSLAKSQSPAEFAAYVKAKLSLDGLRYVDGGRPVTRVAVSGGSGGDYVGLAIKQGAQALVTADIKHNQLLEAAESGLTLVDGGHFATENVIIPPLTSWLEQALPGLPVTLSKSSANPSKAL